MTRKYIKSENFGTYIRTPEIRKKNSLALEGKPKSKEHTEKNRLSHMGLKQSIETRRKRSISHTGKIPTKEAIQKSVDIRRRNAEKRGYYWSKETIEKRAVKIRGKPSKNKGRPKPPFTKEHREHLSTSHIGRPSWNTGLTKETDERLKKVSEFHKTLRGELASNWQGGLTQNPYGQEFTENLKEQIRSRDEYICQECGISQKELKDSVGRKYRLAIHHIDYDKKNNTPANLITLCRPCHTPTNFNRITWTAYFQLRMICKNLKRDLLC